jgi:uncharacterized protein
MNRLKTFFLFSIGTVLSVAALNSYAASFDCRKASTLVENVICSDNEISALDDSLSAAYSSALAEGKADKIKREQKKWLKKRNSCKDKECVKKQYVQRINELSNLNQLSLKVGDCIDSKIVGKFTRFEGAVAGEGGGEVIVELEKKVGLYLQSVAGLSENANQDKYMYSTADFSKGDKVKLCLVALPDNCPPGDDRGKVYSVTNYKNKKSFVGIDSWHSCGGA